MRRFSIASSSAALKTLSHQHPISRSNFPIEKPTQTPIAHVKEASLKGNPELPNSAWVPKIPVSDSNHQKLIDHHYISGILATKDWSLLLYHELKAKRIVLNTRFVVSVLQNLENPFHPLRFYIWVSNIDPYFTENQSVKRVLSNALYRRGPVVLSPEFVRDIRDSGYRVNEDLLRVLIGSWGRLGLAKYCDEVFGQISFLGISPSTRLYNSVIDALVKSSSLDLAYLKFQQMPADNCKPDRFTYNILIHGVCKVGMVDEALRLVKQMEGLGYPPNVFTYTILIDGFCNAKRVDEAFTVVGTMKVRNVSPNEATIRSLVNGAFRCIAPRQAFELVLRFIEREPMFQRLACETLLCCLADNNMDREAGALLKKLMKRGYSPDSWTLSITFACLVKGLNLSGTCDILDICIDHGIKLGFDTYLSVIEALYRAGRGSQVDQYLNHMFQEGLISNVCSYNMLIDCFCKANMMDKASKAFKEMLHNGISPNLVTFNTLISGHCKDGDVCRAREQLEMLLEHGFKPDIFTFGSIINGLCWAQRIDDALECLSEMVEWGISPNVVTYNTIIRSLCVIGDVHRSQKLLRKMQMEGITPDVFSFNALIQSFCRMGKVEKAKKLFHSMLMLGLTPDNYTYNAFIKLFCQLGRIDEAKELFHAMEENGCFPDSFICNLILDKLVELDLSEEAQSIAKMCHEKGISVKPHYMFHDYSVLG